MKKEAQKMLHNIDYVPGREIKESLGLIVAPNCPSFAYAQEYLIIQAQRANADAVIGVRFFNSSDSACLISAYGTAVALSQ